MFAGLATGKYDSISAFKFKNIHSVSTRMVEHNIDRIKFITHDRSNSPTEVQLPPCLLRSRHTDYIHRASETAYHSDSHPGYGTYYDSLCLGIDCHCTCGM